MEGTPFLEAPGGVRIPTDRRYDRGHTWILSDPADSRKHRLGLSAYVCRWGIEVYFIEDLSAVGSDFAAGGLLGKIETEKAVLNLLAPFAARVTAINELVLADPSVITFDGYGTGWIMELEGEPAGLLTAEEYVAFLTTLPPPQCFAPPGSSNER